MPFFPQRDVLEELCAMKKCWYVLLILPKRLFWKNHFLLRDPRKGFNILGVYRHWKNICVVCYEIAGHQINVFSLHYTVFYCLGLFFFFLEIFFIGLLISKNKDVEKSSEYPPGGPDGDGASYKAVDGIKDRDAFACQCCAFTDHEPSWFHVDLGKDFVIESFEILGRLKPPNVEYENLYRR